MQFLKNDSSQLYFINDTYLDSLEGFFYFRLAIKFCREVILRCMIFLINGNLNGVLQLVIPLPSTNA